MKLRIFLIIFSLLLFFFSYKSCSNSPCSKEELVKCEVIGKLPSYDIHKYNVSEKFLLILKSDRGNFDLDVTPTTFYMAEIGETLYFSLKPREMGIKCDGSLETIGFILFFIAFILAISTVVHYIYEGS